MNDLMYRPVLATNSYFLVDMKGVELYEAEKF